MKTVRFDLLGHNVCTKIKIINIGNPNFITAATRRLESVLWMRSADHCSLLSTSSFFLIGSWPLVRSNKSLLY